MALGDLMVTSRSTAVVEEVADHENDDRINNRDSDVASSSHGAVADNGTKTVTTTTSYGYVPQCIFFRELRHEEFEEYVPSGQANSGVVSKWRTKERVKFNIWEDEYSSEQKVKFSLSVKINMKIALLGNVNFASKPLKFPSGH
ncbi:hypothetical protein BC332_25642 [Capsicum chinense]|nr:hypothetical protein BC332_25642 [Capsicum chinense]